MKPINILKTVVSDVSGILQAGGYFEKGAKKNLKQDEETRRKIRAVLEEKNQKLAERLWVDNPDIIHSLPQMVRLRDRLVETDMKRIIKEMGKGELSKADFERKIKESYLTAPSRLKRIERSEGHVTTLMKKQRIARKAKQKFKTWRAGPSACPLCQAMNGQKRRFSEPYSNGEYVAHRHPNCLCDEIYTVE